MARAFRLERGRVVGVFAEDERGVLAATAADALELLRRDAAERGPDDAADPLASLVGIGSGEEPSDPALARLFPRGSAADDAAAHEFRRFTEHGLRAAKIDHLGTILRTLGDDDRIALSLAEAHAWLLGIGDLRLILAARLDIVTEDDAARLAAAAEQSDETTEAYVYELYNFLSWIQEALSGAFLAQLDQDDDAARPAPEEN